MKKGNRKHRKNARKVKTISVANALASQLVDDIRREIDKEILSGLLDASPIAFVIKVL